MNLIFLGAPGAGKGTQADVVSRKLGIPAISTGNIIREAVKKGTELGLLSKSYIEAGQLVPDEVVIDIIKERLSQPDCGSGFILDGFPRTIPQAQALERMGVRIDRVIEIDVPDEEIIKRMSGRRVCENCGDTYHVTDKPSKDGVSCDKCGGKLVMRKDDSPEIVLERLSVYHKQTKPLKDYYEQKGILRTVKGQKEVSDTTKLTLKAIEEK